VCRRRRRRRRRLDFNFWVSRGWFRIFTFRCPEVRLDFSFVGVQRLDQNFHFEVSRGWIRIFTFGCPEVGLEFSLLGAQRFGLDFVTFVVVAAAWLSVVIWRYPIALSLSIWNARMINFLFFFGRTLGPRARSSSFVPLADFKL
jgi:hypothetical protein